ncbi:RNA polymerase sigma factor [Demequina aurantiaca]|uniref:RNA polymerase sigma factor n=1 Tax=Demequina aurantiaca TaxID=676200 RepID=UPI003D34A7FA
MSDLVTELDANAGDLLRYLERRIGLDDAPDLLTETLTVAWRREKDLPRDPEQARMWLFGIAKGVLANAVRGQVRRQRLADRLRAISGRTATNSPAADAGLAVRDAIARLPAELAEVVRLVHWEGFTLAEIAILEDVAPSTVRSRYARAKSLIEQALADRSAVVSPPP